MNKVMKRSVLNLSLVAGLLGAGLVGLPATANATETPSVVAQAKQTSLEGGKGRFVVKAGNTSIVPIPFDAPESDELTFRFQGRPLKGIHLTDDKIEVSLPETQESGVHRVTVRISNGREVVYSRIILDIRGENEF